MAFEVEIGQLATELLGKDDAEQLVSAALCVATEARQWDQVTKWNRVHWRMRMMARRAMPRSSVGQVSAAP